VTAPHWSRIASASPNVYRREDGEKIVHRHADHVPIDQIFPAKYQQE
jgi:hypothetical protein